MPATFPSWLGTLLFGVRHVLNGGSAVNDVDTLNFAGFTVAYNSGAKRIDITFPGTIATLTINPGGLNVTGPVVLGDDFTATAGITTLSDTVVTGSLATQDVQVGAQLTVSATTVINGAQMVFYPMVAPASPASGTVTLYVDVADSHLKAKNHAGTTVTIL